eukprot:4560794-Prymnesium_polylepis.1
MTSDTSHIPYGVHAACADLGPNTSDRETHHRRLCLLASLCPAIANCTGAARSHASCSLARHTSMDARPVCASTPHCANTQIRHQHTFARTAEMGLRIHARPIGTRSRRSFTQSRALHKAHAATQSPHQQPQQIPPAASSSPRSSAAQHISWRIGELQPAPPRRPERVARDPALTPALSPSSRSCQSRSGSWQTARASRSGRSCRVP